VDVKIDATSEWKEWTRGEQKLYRHTETGEVSVTPPDGGVCDTAEDRDAGVFERAYERALRLERMRSNGLALSPSGVFSSPSREPPLSADSIEEIVQ
jgi:hypothetical protein